LIVQPFTPEEAIMKHRFFRFGYPCPVRPPKDPGSFQIRDGGAFMEVTEPLRDYGWQFETLICNYPYRKGESSPISGRDQFTFLTPDDCLVQTTRPPLNDHETRNRKRITRSCSHLENAIFAELRIFFDHICREQLRLSSRLVDRLAVLKGVSRQEIVSRWHFRQTHDARIARTGTIDAARRDRNHRPNDYRSLGVFLHLPGIRDYGCRLIVSFGMGGFETQVWNGIIRKRFPGWLDRPGFVLAEMDLNRCPERPETFHFVDGVPVRMILDEPFRIDEAAVAEIAA
jgi:hypothetical protein